MTPAQAARIRASGNKEAIRKLDEIEAAGPQAAPAGPTFREVAEGRWPTMQPTEPTEQQRLDRVMGVFTGPTVTTSPDPGRRVASFLSSADPEEKRRELVLQGNAKLAKQDPYLAMVKGRVEENEDNADDLAALEDELRKRQVASAKPTIPGH
jgi:hypothetical protein